MTSLRATAVEIDLDAVKFNFNAIRARLAGEDFICPMVKANAYGHGDVECARALREAGAGALGVALFEEGERLRAHGDGGEILVFAPFEERALTLALEWRLTPVVGSIDQLRQLARARSSGRKPLHLEFDTGMSRLGLAPEDAAEARGILDANPALKLEGVCTHLRHGMDAGEARGESADQFSRFEAALVAFDGLRFRAHALNSAGSVNANAGQASPARANAARFGSRPGIAIYGSRPPAVANVDPGLKPAMAWKTRLCQLRRLRTGEKVSYGGKWTAQRPSLIGAMPVGYADGYLRAYSPGGSVLVRGHRAPLAGTICMDYTMIDLTDIERESGEIAVGEPVTLLGRQGAESIDAHELATIAQTIAYDVFVSISARVPRLHFQAAGRE